MRNLLVALAFAASPLAAQEAAQKPELFPPVTQLLGQDKAPVPQARADFDTLVTRLNAPDAATRRSAAAALGRPGEIRAVPYLGAALLRLNDKDEVRVAAAMALGRIADWRAETFLRQGLRDSSRQVRFAAALALGKCKTAETPALLGDRLAHDPDWWVRFAAAVALGDDRSLQSVTALGQAARADSEWQVRMQAVRSLGQLGSRDAALALAAPLQDPDPSVRAAAAMALGDIGGPDSLRLLRDALRTEHEEFARLMLSGALKKLLARQ